LTSNILPQRFNEQLQTCSALISLKLHGHQISQDKYIALQDDWMSIVLAH